jgi:hypothetical protein
MSEVHVTLQVPTDWWLSGAANPTPTKAYVILDEARPSVAYASKLGSQIEGILSVLASTGVT